MVEAVGKPRPFRAEAQEIPMRLFRHENAILITILIVLIAVLAIMSGGTSLALGNVKSCM